MRILLLITLLFLTSYDVAFSATPAFYLTNEVVIMGDGVTAIKPISVDIVKFVKSEFMKSGVNLAKDDSEANFSLTFKVETELERGFFNAKTIFKNTSINVVKDGITVETITFDERTPAGALMKYGEEGEAYSKKAANYLVSNLLKSDLVAKFVGQTPETKLARAPVKQKENDLRQRTIIDATAVYKDSVGSMPKGKGAGKYDVAVIIGNRNYKKTSNVDYATNDAQKMRELALKTMGFLPENIIYVEDATLSDFTEIFGSQRDSGRSKLHNFIKKDVSNVFIYYVGHGAPDIQEEKPKAYFVPVDADPQYIGASGYKVQTLYDNLAKLPAKNITVILDSCFSGNSPTGLLFKGISGLVIVDKTAKMTAKNSLVLTSTSENQVSSWYNEKEHSLFTYFFLKGLQGEADKNGDRKITAEELNEYLTDKVSGLSKRLTGNLQQPVLSGDEKRVLVTLE
ncbi:MAG: caspase family protein [Desulfuromonadaceae bacterium]|nr:caspase family protein [Desulfuromonadaceae bacterium]